MKFNGTIFVEGVADSKFISDFVKKRFDYDLRKKLELQEVDGKDSLHKFRTNFEQSSLNKTNLLIFDANGSFENRKGELLAKATELQIEFELFLFPNNANSGDLETLLESIIPNKNLPILQCFDKLNKCLEGVNGFELKQLNRKTKIHNYTSVLAGSELAKERDRDYLITDHWNLESVQLNNLYSFLSTYFVNGE